MTAKTEKSSNSKDYLIVSIADQRFGIPVLQVQDVLRQQKVTRIPLASREVSGSLNLRGRIVTAIDVRRRLGLPDGEKTGTMSVVVEHNHELFSLIIDKVGDVISLEDSDFEKNPGTLDASWREVSMGIFQLDKELLIIMDVSKFLENIG